MIEAIGGHGDGQRPALHLPAPSAVPAGDSLKSSLGDPGVQRGAGAIATLFGLLFVPPILLAMLPQTWQNSVGPYVPMQAGEQIYVAVSHEASALAPWTGFAVFTGYAAAALSLGVFLINRRDA